MVLVVSSVLDIDSECSLLLLIAEIWKGTLPIKHKISFGVMNVRVINFCVMKVLNRITCV